ncbi:MAG: hypothetical protein J6B12_01105 [Clostridia bacterium]|nr:hypothetical protein [Clostridia bacterium]
MAHKAEGTQAYLDMVDEVQKIVADENAPADVKALVGDRVQRRKGLVESYWDRDLSREQNRYVVDTELISNMIGDLLGNSNFVERMAKRQSSAWERFVMAMKAADAGKAAGISKEAQKYLSGLYKAYVKAVDDAGGGVKVSSIADADEKEKAPESSERTSKQKKNQEKNYENGDVYTRGRSERAHAGSGSDGIGSENRKEQGIRYIQVDRQGYGIVVIDSDRLKNGIRYIKKSDSASVIAYSFVPKIIKRGIVIGGHPNHKERGYPTVTFAAPVEINGVRGNMAVVVRQEGKNYYKMHKLRMPDGSLFIYDNAERNSADRAGHSFYAKETLSPTDTVSIKSIPQNSEKSTENEKKVSDERSSKKKVYKRAEASATLEETVSEHLVFSDAYAKLKGQSKREAASMLWKVLNSAEGDEAQKRAALNVADYVLDHAVVAAFEGNAYTDAQAKTVAALKPYLHKLDLDGIKGEIRNRFGKDISPYLLWGKHKDSAGVAPDAIVAELAELGVIIDAKNPADIFFEIYDTYKKAKDGLEASAASLLKHALSAEERAELREQISSDILRAYEEKGVETLDFNQFYKELEKAQRSAEVWKAAQKYMIMGYLGYKNTLGKEQVQA